MTPNEEYIKKLALESILDKEKKQNKMDVEVHVSIVAFVSVILVICYTLPLLFLISLEIAVFISIFSVYKLKMYVVKRKTTRTINDCAVISLNSHEAVFFNRHTDSDYLLVEQFATMRLVPEENNLYCYVNKEQDKKKNENYMTSGASRVRSAR